MCDVCVYIIDSYDICTIYPCVGTCVFVSVCDMIFVLHMLFACAMYMCVLLRMKRVCGGHVCTLSICTCVVFVECVYLRGTCAGFPKAD